MSRASQASDRAAEWIIAEEEGGWTDGQQADLEAWLAESDGNKAAYWRLKHSWDEAGRVSALGYSFSSDHEGSMGGRSEGYRSVRWFIPASIAAGVAAVALTGYSSFFAQREPNITVATTQFATPVGARKAIELPDGSKVELNTDSRVRIAVTDTRREFWLDGGEAYFEVARRDGLPFIVHAGSRKVTVLGTKFSVRRLGEEVAVSVVEGRVRVDEREGTQSLRSTIVAGGDIARTSGSATLITERSEQRVENSLAWREGMLSFDQTRLADVAAEFNRYNRKPILVPDAKAADLRIGGVFPAADPHAFVRLLRDAYGMTVDETPEAIRVSS